jgi:hypothetical protein
MEPAALSKMLRAPGVAGARGVLATLLLVPTSAWPCSLQHRGQSA